MDIVQFGPDSSKALMSEFDNISMFESFTMRSTIFLSNIQHFKNFIFEFASKDSKTYEEPAHCCSHL